MKEWHHIVKIPLLRYSRVSQVWYIFFSKSIYFLFNIFNLIFIIKQIIYAINLRLIMCIENAPILKGRGNYGISYKSKPWLLYVLLIH